jgi:hypothetical protein
LNIVLSPHLLHGCLQAWSFGLIDQVQRHVVDELSYQVVELVGEAGLVLIICLLGKTGQQSQLLAACDPIFRPPQALIRRFLCCVLHMYS